MRQSDKIYVAGHTGLVGSALVRLLHARGFTNLVTRSRAELDLRDERAVRDFFAEERPEVVVLAAAKVGGIKANIDAPVEFLIENLQIQNNVIRVAHEAGARKLLFLGSSCIYPKFAPQPIPESALLSGPGDNFDLETSHALAALLRKAHEAKMSGAGDMIVWGTGEPRREFLHVDDLAAAILFLLEKYDSPEIINVGCGQDISIRQLAELICDVVGFRGELRWDRSKPDGTPRKLLDVSKIKKLGWQPTISLRDGVARFYEWFLDNYVPPSMASVR